MEVTFLGTGTSGGVPLIGCRCEVCSSANPKDNRLRTSILIKVNGLTLVTDCGPDFRQQMLREKISHVDALLMTHAHKDHTAGLDDIRALNFINQKPLDIYCDEETEQNIREQYGYIFQKSDYPHLPQINFRRIADEPFSVNGVEILPIEIDHGYMRVTAFRLGDFTYVTDAKTISPGSRNKMRGTKVLILNALRETPHYSHLSISEALEIVEDIRPEHTYFIHMSHQFGLHDEMQKKLPAHVTVAYDGLRLSI